MSKKGDASKTHLGDKDYTTKRGDKDYHQKGKDVRKKRKPYTKKAKKGTAVLDGKKITFNKGGLHRSLKVPISYKFTKSIMRRLDKIKNGKTFAFQGNAVKMTPKIHKQLILGINLMG